MPEVKDTKLNTSSSTQEARAFISQKLEKIAHALYLVTSSFPHDEPLRHALRNMSLSLLSSKQFIVGKMSNSDPGIRSLSDILQELSSLISLSQTSKLISDANADILKNEIGTLLESGRDIYAEPLLSSGDLSVPGNINVLEKTVGTSENEGDTKPSNKAPASSKKSTQKKPNGVSKVKKRRRNEILDILNDKGEVGIKDISKEIQGCSRKTIQRELSTLTDKGLVSKEGERRWSTYRLTEKGRQAAGS